MSRPTPAALIAFLVLGAVALGQGLEFGKPCLTPRNAVFVDGDHVGPSDGSCARPFKTIMAGVTAANPGGSVLVDWSTMPYREKVVIAKSIRIVGNNWNQPTAPHPELDPPLGTPSGIPVWIEQNVSGVLFQGFDVTMGTYDSSYFQDITWAGAIWISDSTADITIRDCIINGSRPDADFFSLPVSICQSQDITIEHCRFEDLDHGNQNQPKITLCIATFGIDGFLVRNNRFTRINEESKAFWLNHFVCLMDIQGCTNTRIENNLIHDITLPAARWSTTSNSPDPNAPPDPGRTSCDAWIVDCYQCDTMTVVNNTIANVDISQCQNTIRQMRGFDFRNSINLDLRNNVLAFMSTTTPQGIHPTAMMADQPLATLQHFSDVDNTWNTRYWAGIGEGPTGIAANPMFLGLPGLEYHLAPGSPCIDTGDSQICDPDGSVSDMGCYGGPRSAFPVGTLR